MTEPALTNCRIVLPAPGFLESVQDLARRHSALFSLDETHTICCGPGGYAGLHGIAPDMLTLGKPIGGGVPAAAYGMSADVADRVRHLMAKTGPGIFALGGTLTGHALALAGMRAMLETVMTEASFAAMFDASGAIEKGVEEVLAQHGSVGHVIRLGARVAYDPFTSAAASGRESMAATNEAADRLLHLYMLNRGVLLTPFQNMCLVAPQTGDDDTALHAKLLDDLLGELSR
jgi:glutamate-1-semialdehyde 2,1-aminomutase